MGGQRAGQDTVIGIRLGVPASSTSGRDHRYQAFAHAWGYRLGVDFACPAAGRAAESPYRQCRPGSMPVRATLRIAADPDNRQSDGLGPIAR
jgi:hypothetical protein